MKSSSFFRALSASLAVVMALGLLLLVEPLRAHESTSSSIYDLAVSSKDDRSEAGALSSVTVSGNIYVFVQPESGIDQVDFFFDDANMSGAPTKVEKAAPYDFKGGTVSTANPFDTTKVSDGSHTITARIYLSSGNTEVVSSAFTVGNTASEPDPALGEWQTRASSSTNRQEVAYVQTGGKFYLAGGSTTGLHERYDPATNSWSTIAPLPVPDSSKLDHIQGVELNGLIYYVGGLLKFPGPHDSTVRIYDPATDTFSEGAPMPDGRGRGAGGVAVYNGKIYYAGGLHDGSAVAWFDVYDPVTDTWTQLPDMPRVRDHFHAAVVDGKFYAIGGRNAAINATTDKVDVYSLTSGTGGTWQTPNTALPTARGGFAAAVLGQEILIIGGEGGGTTYNTVEAYDTVANSWRQLAPMPTARHGIQAAVCNGGIYVAAGGKTQGGSSPTNVHETFFLNGPTTCDAQTEPPTSCTITGTSSNDLLEGTSGSDVICGLGGNDTIKGLGGNDILKGEGGADKLFGGAGDDAFDGGLGSDIANFSGSPAAVTASLTDNTATGEGSDTLTSIERLLGSSKNDVLSGSGEANALNGGGGADTLDGLDGTDKLNGGGGNDSLWGGLGNDTVVGNGGADGLNGEDGDDSLNSKDGVNGNDSVDGGVGTDTCTMDTTEKSIVNCE